MKQATLLFILFLVGCFVSSWAHPKINLLNKIGPLADSTRMAELDNYWTQLSTTVKEGDYEGYSSLYHDDAVIIFASGENRFSVPISKALAGWYNGFIKTKEGKQKDQVEFRFSQRIGDETTAHETGIFWFKSINNDGKVLADKRIHFEMLLVKKDNNWISLMEYQKEEATEEEWKALE